MLANLRGIAGKMLRIVLRIGGFSGEGNEKRQIQLISLM
jgi:hypothetical protein